MDEILDLNYSAGQEELGIVDIPAEQIVGTRTRGRQAAFAGNFLPLAAIDSEFASKMVFVSTLLSMVTVPLFGLILD